MTDEHGDASPGLIARRSFFKNAYHAAAAPTLWMAAGKNSVAGADGSASPVGPALGEYRKSVDRAIGYLDTRGQAADGSFSSQSGIGPTLLVATALVRQGRGLQDPCVARSLQYIQGFVRSDGSICTPGTLYANYETCLAIACLAVANRDARFDLILRKAEAFVRKSQWGEGEDKDRSDLTYGGAGYGKHKRPDLSNTAFLLDALKDCGAPPDDPAIQRALIFVSRCQNLESAHNTTGFAAKNPDGGFYYTCAVGGASMAGTTPNGGLRSYGSMTYSGLTSLIYAGLQPDDPRVKAAVAWIRQNYDVRSNPGLGDAGLYYYYHVYAKALAALGADLFEDASGVKHDWRRELAEELFRRQRENGSWVNDNSRWMEGDPNLTTGYALLALSYCRVPSQA